MFDKYDVDLFFVIATTMKVKYVYVATWIGWKIYCIVYTLKYLRNSKRNFCKNRFSRIKASKSLKFTENPTKFLTYTLQGTK